MGFFSWFFGMDKSNEEEESNPYAKPGANCSNCHYFDMMKWENRHVSDDGREVGPLKYELKFWCGSTGDVMKCKNGRDDIYEKCLCKKPSAYHRYK